jgi:YVTN family beta-propeller protein
MGPAKIPMEDPGWADISLPSANGDGPIIGRAVRDPVTPSWYPYYYRVVALGEQDLPAGKIRGQSSPSPTQEAFLTPSGPPLLDQVEEVQSFGESTSIAVGARPHGIAYDARRNRVYVANYLSNSLSVIDAETNSVTVTIPLGPRPFAVAVHLRPGLIFVSHSGAPAITVINAVTGSTRVIGVGGRPAGLAVHQTIRRVYVTVPELNRVVVIDGVTGAPIAVIPVGGRPAAVAVNMARNRVYVTGPTSGILTVINAATNAIIATLAVGGRPESVDVNPTTRRVYVASRTPHSLVVFHDTTTARLAEIPLGMIPTEVKVDERTNRIYISHAGGGAISLVDGESHALLEQISLPNRPTGLAMHRRLDRAYVSQNAGTAVAVLSFSSGRTNRVFRLRSDLPVRPTPLGEARLEVVRAKIDAQGQMQRARLIAVAPRQVAEGPPLAVLASPTQEQLDAMPEINRGQPDDHGRVVYTVRVRTEDVEGGAVLMTARDPLGHTTEVQVSEVGA